MGIACVASMSATAALGVSACAGVGELCGGVGEFNVAAGGMLWECVLFLWVFLE